MGGVVRMSMLEATVAMRLLRTGEAIGHVQQTREEQMTARVRSRTLVQQAQARSSGRRIDLIRSFLRPLTFINVLSLIAFFVVVGGSAFAAISAGDPAASPQASTELAGDAAPTGENGPLTEQPGTPAEAGDIPLPEGLVPDGGAPASEPEEAPSPEAPELPQDLPVQDAPSRQGQTLDSPGPQAADSETHRGAAKPKKAHEDARGDEGPGGPPPWAPAHGFRCKRAGNAPGSAAFHDCIKSRKKQKRAGPNGRH